MEIHQKATENGDALLYEYDVFLSFRGPDTRATFTDVVYKHLSQAAGLRVFRDDDELDIGDMIEEILPAIDNSKLCIPIFSKTFAQSKWCLLEVTRMVEMHKDILPIFYGVTVDDVKLETPVYNQFMPQHLEKSGEKKVEKWKEALKTIAAREGKQVLNTGNYGSYSAFCESFVKELLVKLKYRRIFNIAPPIGLEDQVQHAMQRLDIDSRAVRYFGIHGMGGIGKTTLAKDIFNKIKDQFDGSCFLEDIRESFRRHGTTFLMKKLLNSLDILASRRETDEDLSRLMEEHFRSKKILIVLDDVDQWDQIKKLAGKSSWFGPGSRIMVTSRDKSVMERGDGKLSDGEIWDFDMEPIRHDHALQLFNRHAFKEEIPSAGFEELSEEAAYLMGGLPLALEIIGSLLHNKRREVWIEVIQKVQDIPEQDVMKRLKISYDALSDEQKHMYLDIACFFVGSSVTYPIYMWRTYKFSPNSNLQILCSMSLVKFSDDGKVSMHDVLRDLGREIVHEESIKIPANRSRLWEDKTAKKVLMSTKVKEKVAAIRVEGDCAIDLMTQETKIGSLKNLKYLDLQRTNLRGDFEDVFPDLIWLSYHCHTNFQATTFAMTKLVILEFSCTNIDENWHGWKQLEKAENLKILDLSEAKNLTRTPYFSKDMSLERLILNDCRNLGTVHSSIGELNSLVVLDLQFTKISELPDSVQGLVELKELRLGGCHHLKKLPPTLGALKSLVKLDLSETSLVELPPGVGELASLKKLDLSLCSLMRKLPDSLGTITSLVELDLSSSGVLELPETIGGLENLEKLSLHDCSNIKALHDTIGHLKRLILLDLSRTGITELPESIGGLENLREIDLQHCPLKTLPKSFGALKQLEKLDARYTDLSSGLPNEISGLSSLMSLNLSLSRVRELPSSINQLHRLTHLHLLECNQLQELPDLPTNLTELYVASTSLHGVHQLSKLQSLTRLRLASPLWSSDSVFGIWKLSQLVDLRLFLLSNTNLSDEFGNLTRLKKLKLGLQNLRCIHRLPLNLEKIYIACIEKDLHLPNLPDLKNLSYLEIKGVTETSRLRISLPESLRELYVGDSPSLESWPNVSHLKNLRTLHVVDCESLTDIPGLGKLKRLEYLVIERCRSLTKLENLSELERIVRVRIDSCRKLGYPEGIDRSKVIIVGLEFQEISEAITNEGHDICSLLSSPGRDFLIRDDGHQVKVDTLRGKKVLLYFHRSWMTFAYLLMWAYLKWRAQGEFCVVVRVPDDSVYDEIFKKWYSRKDWLAVPFSDRDRCRRLLMQFKRSVREASEEFRDHHDEAPQLVIFNESGRVLTAQGFDLIGSYGPLAYPFTPKRIQYFKTEDEKRRENQSITRIFKAPLCTEFVLTLDGNMLPVFELEGKIVGIYFSSSSSNKCINMTCMLHEVYDELKSNGESFEIVWAPIETSINPYERAFSKLPGTAVPSWLPFCFRLYFYFRVSALPTLVMIGQDGNTLQLNAAEGIQKYGAKAYPFTPKKIEKARKEECKRLVSACREFAITNREERVDPTTLAGKNILLYFSCQTSVCRTFLPKLMEAYDEIKTRGYAFEVIFISDDQDEASFRECFSTMPWLALSFGDERIPALFSELEVMKVPNLVAIGPTDQIITKDVYHLIMAYGSNAYPFTSEHISDMVKSWPHKLQHALHPHELALVERDYICNSCDYQLGIPLLSYYCKECDLNLHPQCAFKGRSGKAIKEERERLVVSACKKFAITKTEERVDASALVGMNILLYFSAHWSSCCQAFTPKLLEAYDEIKARDDAFEVIFISIDKDEESFRKCFSTMPWLALPFGDQRIPPLGSTLEVTQIPTLVAIAPTDQIITKDVEYFIEAYGSDAYPFTNEHISNIMVKSWPQKLQHPLHLHQLALIERDYKCDGCDYQLRMSLWSYSCISCNFNLHPKCAFEGGRPESLEELGTRLESMAIDTLENIIDSIRVSDSLQFSITSGEYQQSVSDLLGKNILLYFSCHWGSRSCPFLSNFLEAYNEMKARDGVFEVIFISYDANEASFREYISTLPWLALPFGDERIHALRTVLEVTRLPTLAAIGPTNQIIAKDARDLIIAYGSDAYPFINEHISNMVESWPQKLQHPLHLHELALTMRRYRCDACNYQLAVHAWSYYCKECDFDLHPKCAFKGGRCESAEQS